MIHYRKIMIGIGIGFILVAGAENGLAKTADAIIAIVNNDVITQFDLELAAKQRRAANLIAPEKTVKTASDKDLLDGVIDDLLLKQAIGRSKTDVGDADVTRAITNILEQNHITLATLKGELAKQNVSYTDYRQSLKDEIRRIKFMNQEIGGRIAITEREMLRYFQDHLAEFAKTDSITLAQIFLPFHDGMTDSDFKKLKHRAEKLARQARAGDFAAVARGHSEGPFAENGGNMGVIDLATLKPELAEAVVKMRTGEVSGVIPSPIGLHIVKVVARDQARLEDYEKLKGQINDILYEEKMNEAIVSYVAKLKQRAYIRIINERL